MKKIKHVYLCSKLEVVDIICYTNEKFDELLLNLTNKFLIMSTEQQQTKLHRLQNYYHQFEKGQITGP